MGAMILVNEDSLMSGGPMSLPQCTDGSEGSPDPLLRTMPRYLVPSRKGSYEEAKRGSIIDQLKQQREAG